MNIKLRGTVYAVLSAVIFGLNPLIAQTIYAKGGNAISLAFYRMLFGTIFGWFAQCVLQKGRLMIGRDSLKRLFLCSSGFALTPVLLYSSYNYIDSGLATTIHFVYPVLVILGCALFYRERITGLKTICMVLCVSGIALLYASGRGVSLVGIAIAFFSGVAYAFYAVYLAKSGLQELQTFQLNFWLNLFGLAYAGAFVLFGGSLTVDFAPPIWLLIISFSLCNAGVAVTLFQLGTRYIGPQKASLFSTFEPLTSVLVGIIIYKEIVTVRTLCGMLCILAAVMILAVGKEDCVSRS